MQVPEIDPVSSSSSMHEPASPHGAISYLRTHPKYKMWLASTVVVSSMTLLLALVTLLVDKE